MPSHTLAQGGTESLTQHTTALDIRHAYLVYTTGCMHAQASVCPTLESSSMPRHTSAWPGRECILHEIRQNRSLLHSHSHKPSSGSTLQSAGTGKQHMVTAALRSPCTLQTCSHIPVAGWERTPTSKQPCTPTSPWQRQGRAALPLQYSITARR